MTIQVGAEAPDFELLSTVPGPDQKPTKLKLSDLRGKKNVVLAFYPLDFSPVCSKENACFATDLPDFEAVGAQIYGISVDSAWAHVAFAKQLGLKYPLLADFHPKGAVAETYGMYLPERGMTKRATVIVGKDGKVKYVKEQEIPEARDNQAILAELKKLG
jgi:peroxiredoxin